MIRKFLIIATASLFIFGCKGRDKTTSDSANMGADGAASDTVDSTAMNFDPQGSDSGRIAGLSTVYFDYDKSNLTQSARDTLKENAAWLKKNPSVRVQIEGHTDSRGSIEYNVALGERRANAAMSYLKSMGVSGNRLSVISYGKERPLVAEENESAWSKNRRANFVPIQ